MEQFKIEDAILKNKIPVNAIIVKQDLGDAVSPMRKEIFGILLFFLVIFTLISLLSYSPADPSINNAKATGQINNLF